MTMTCERPTNAPPNPGPGEPDTTVAAKFERLKQILLAMNRMAVAFSGGIDSALLLRVSLDLLGAERVVAFTARSEASPAHEIQDALRLASEWGARHELLDAHDLDDEGFVSNTRERCYHCKKRRFSRIRAQARQMGLQVLVHGENVDDGADFRPGSRAARELGFRSPLVEAGLTKAEVRSLARSLGIDIWAKPASACLASRIPYGSPITAEKLHRVDAAESFIRSLGFAEQVRVRHHERGASIEVDAEALDKVAEASIRGTVVKKLKELGFASVVLDLEGYRAGSLNPQTMSHDCAKSSRRKQDAGA